MEMRSTVVVSITWHGGCKMFIIQHQVGPYSSGVRALLLYNTAPDINQPSRSVSKPEENPLINAHRQDLYLDCILKHYCRLDQYHSSSLSQSDTCGDQFY